MIFMIEIPKADLEAGQKIKVFDEIPYFKGYDKLLFHEGENVYAFTDTFGACVETPEVCNAFTDTELGFHDGDREWIKECVEKGKFLFFVDWDNPQFL